MDKTNQLIEFYTNSGLDAAGRSFECVLAMSDAALKRTHDYIQWLFPLAIESELLAQTGKFGWQHNSR